MHLFATRLKCLLRNRAMLFWTLLFPIILASFFNLAFSNITSGESFETIKISIVESPNLTENFRHMVEDAKISEGKNLFSIAYVSLSEAEDLLDKSAITGYIEVESATKLSLTIKGAGINETILKTFLDEYLETSSAFESIMYKSSGEVTIEELLAQISAQKNYLKEKDNGTSSPNIMLIYFYSLMGMALIYGGIWGTNEIIGLQANLSGTGLRVSISPTKRLKLLLINMSCAFIIHFSEILILLAYIYFVIGVTFGNNLPYVMLLCILGSFTGISFGAFVAIVLRKASEGMKVAVTSITGVLGGFLAGMMNANVKYFIDTKLPVLSYINPVNVMTDGLFSLYYFPTKERYFTNIMILGIMIVVFVTVTYINFRRDDYESL